MNKTKILSIILSSCMLAGSVAPAMGAEDAATKETSVTLGQKEADEVADDYINDTYSQLVVDCTNDNVLPAKFRTTKDSIDENSAKGINLTGLSDLNMSGSKMPSENGLKLIKEKAAGYELYDVDLRQESHGLVNGMPVTWFGTRDDANRGLSEKQVLTDEKNKLKKIKEDGSVTFEVLPKGKSVDVGEVKDITSVETEEEMAKDLGVGYIRIQVSDHYKPEAKQIDEFITFVKGLPEDAWLNFHCRGGAGRTTTFMCMYDMMKNSKNVSFDDILKRQALIGGENLLDGNAEDKANPGNTRADALREFYNYCYDNNDDFTTSYSQYETSKNQSSSNKDDCNTIVKNSWISENGNWYYADKNGNRVNNTWKEINSNWYYFNTDGTMKTGWLEDNSSNWYFLKDSGEMAHSEYINGYWLNESGEWE